MNHENLISLFYFMGPNLKIINQTIKNSLLESLLNSIKVGIHEGLLTSAFEINPRIEYLFTHLLRF